MTQEGLSHLRVGHAEREAVTTILQEAAGDGRLGMDELEERVEAALHAKTYADLEPLVEDLGADLPWSRSRSSVQRLPQQPDQAGWSREDPLRLDGGASSEKRDGAWLVPPFLRVSSGAGSVKLNCLNATVAAPVIDVQVVAGAGSVLFIVPSGWAVDHDRLGKGIGSKTIKVGREAAPGSPLLVLSGNVGIGSLKVRPGSARELRRAGQPGA